MQRKSSQINTADPDVADTVAWRDRKHNGEVFIVYTNAGKIDDWRQQPDPTSVLDVVQTTDIFHEGSSNGEPGRASKALLQYVRGTQPDGSGGGVSYMS